MRWVSEQGDVVNPQDSASQGGGIGIECPAEFSVAADESCATTEWTRSWGTPAEIPEKDPFEIRKEQISKGFYTWDKGRMFG